MRTFIGALFVAALISFVPPGEAQKPKKEYARGRVAPANLAALKHAAFKRHGYMAKRLPKVTAAKWDCRDLGQVPPIVDQGDCGSCWDFSGTSVVTSALIKAGYGKADGSFALSEQYTLDCYSNGGCSGDDNTTVLAHAKSIGLPLTKDYGPYSAHSGRCKSDSGMKLFQIKDWGFCSPNQDGVADTQDIKNMMVAYGPIGAAIAADSSFMNVGPGEVFDRTTSTGIDHDIVLVGWDDAKGKKGAWLLRNSWGVSWCDQGYCWIGYGVNLVGTEAVWATVTPIVPPEPPPGPTPPPGPVPPPVPPGAPVVTSALALTQKIGDPFTYQIVATNSPSVFGAVGMPDGWTCTAAGSIHGTLKTTKQSVTLVVANSAGASTATLVVSSTAVPVTITLSNGQGTVNLNAEQVQIVLDAQVTKAEPPCATPNFPPQNEHKANKKTTPKQRLQEKRRKLLYD